MISRKLYDKPNCVEELSEMREWMRSIPEKLKEHTVRRGRREEGTLHDVQAVGMSDLRIVGSRGLNPGRGTVAG